MIKNWDKFNEGWFSKKESESDLIPKGFKSSTGRPSAEESERMQKDLDKLSSKIEAGKIQLLFFRTIIKSQSFAKN